jgi:hypothetical protein
MRYDGAYWMVHTSGSLIVIREGGCDGLQNQGIYNIKQTIETDMQLTAVRWSNRASFTTVGTGQLAASTIEGKKTLPPSHSPPYYLPGPVEN